jgi:hypothetical protein
VPQGSGSLPVEHVLLAVPPGPITMSVALFADTLLETEAVHALNPLTKYDTWTRHVEFEAFMTVR